MTRDHYKGVPRQKYVLVGTNGHLQARGPRGGTDLSIIGKATMASGRATISGGGIRITSSIICTPAHNGPTNLSYALFNGYAVVSGTGNGEFSYQITL